MELGETCLKDFAGECIQISPCKPEELYCSEAVVELGSYLVGNGLIVDIDELQYFYEKPWKWESEWKEYLDRNAPVPFPSELSEVAETALKTMGWKDYAESVFESFDIGEDTAKGRYERVEKVLKQYPKADYREVSRFFDGPCERRKWRRMHDRK